MNALLIISGVFALFTTVGHFAVGSKRFLVPMLQASFDEVAKKIMHCVFHYVSAYLVLSTCALFALGFGVSLGVDGQLLARFIAVHYAVFAITQIAIALTSSLDKALARLFQWVLFIPIALFAWLGAL